MTSPNYAYMEAACAIIAASTQLLWINASGSNRENYKFTPNSELEQDLASARYSSHCLLILFKFDAGQNEEHA